MLRLLREDIDAVLAWDPAARNSLEVLLCYPGMHALWAHHINHFLWNHGLKLVARILSHIVRRRTGVEIHPGATIGRRVVIDHGMGIVIGETAVIGSNVRMYSGVVIGTTSHLPGKRHPTIEDDVLIGANALLLGPILVGREAKIGAGAIVHHDVLPGMVIGLGQAESHRKPQGRVCLAADLGN